VVQYVEYMGGAVAILHKAQGDFEKGDYRWVAEAVKHVVFADPTNTTAKELLADAYEQLGYQAVSGPWRSVYL
jgi:alkyl sulfatase BDS1-like metallo-beta-lactamase superfamily hydrolase